MAAPTSISHCPIAAKIPESASIRLRRLGTYAHIVALTNAIMFEIFIVGLQLKIFELPRSLSFLEPDVSFIRKGFCVSWPDSSTWIQSHALSFYSDVVFAALFMYLSSRNPDQLSQRALSGVGADKWGGIIAHGLAHFAFGYWGDAWVDDQGDWMYQDEWIFRFTNLCFTSLWLLFWFPTLASVVCNRVLGGKGIGKVVKLLVGSFLVTFVHGFLPPQFNFGYVQTVVLVCVALVELSEPEAAKDVWWSVYALSMLPLVLIGWLEATQCESWMKPIGGHVFYDTSISLCHVGYYLVVRWMFKARFLAVAKSS